jgi:hypothetical protein
MGEMGEPALQTVCGDSSNRIWDRTVIWRRSLERDVNRAYEALMTSDELQRNGNWLLSVDLAKHQIVLYTIHAQERAIAMLHRLICYSPVYVLYLSLARRKPPSTSVQLWINGAVHRGRWPGRTQLDHISDRAHDQKAHSDGL